MVDGINEIDKNYLSKMMNLTMTPEVITSKDRMSSATIIEGAEKSFAKECLRLCSNPNRKTGVTSDNKSAKREASAKLKERLAMTIVKDLWNVNFEIAFQNKIWRGQLERTF